VAGDEGDEVLHHDRTNGNEGRSTTEGDDGRRWELTKGGSQRRLHFRRCWRASGGRPWTGGKGGEVVLVACAERRKGGEKEGRQR
jgi:hypothetical protein